MQLSDDALTSIQYCANYMADMYNLSFEKAKELIMKSHYPSLLIEDCEFCEHVSFNKLAKEIYELNKELGNV